MIVAFVALALMFTFVAFVAAAGFLLRAVLWFVLLPIKLVVGLVALPFLTVALFIAAACVGVALVGSLLVGASVLLALAGALAAPALIVFGLVWLLVRATRRPAVI